MQNLKTKDRWLSDFVDQTLEELSPEEVAENIVHCKSSLLSKLQNNFCKQYDLIYKYFNLLEEAASAYNQNKSSLNHKYAPGKHDLQDTINIYCKKCLKIISLANGLIYPPQWKNLEAFIKKHNIVKFISIKQENDIVDTAANSIVIARVEPDIKFDDVKIKFNKIVDFNRNGKIILYVMKQQDGKLNFSYSDSDGKVSEIKEDETVGGKCINEFKEYVEKYNNKFAPISYERKHLLVTCGKYLFGLKMLIRIYESDGKYHDYSDDKFISNETAKEAVKFMRKQLIPRLPIASDLDDETINKILISVKSMTGYNDIDLINN